MSIRLPDPIANTTTEAYLAYKAGVLEAGDLKPKLYEPYIHLDAWLAYWTGLVNTYPLDKNDDPEMLTDEEAFIAYLSGVTNTYPQEFRDPADIRVAAYLRYLISARWGRPEYPVNNEEFYLSLMKTKFIPSGEPSSDITIDGTAKAPFVDVKMYGDTYQQSYTGKNLIYLNPNEGQYLNGITQSYNAQTGEITITGTPTESWSNIGAATSITLPAGTYTLSTNKAPETHSVAIYVNHSDKTRTQFYISPSGTSVTVTVPKEIVSYYIYVSQMEIGTLINDTYTMQLELSSSATSFEPYVGGVPSPNPDYPQQIQTVTGTQTVSINGTDYPISLGSIELCKLGTYQDYIYKDGDDWKVHKATNKAVFDGSNDENWFRQNAGTTYGGFFIDVRNGISGSPSYSNKFLNKPQDAPWTGGQYTYTISQSLNATFATVELSSFTQTMAEWREELASSNLVLYYPLATATDTTITDANLIAQLEALVAGGAENGTTYIKVNATDPNLPGLLYVEAPKYE